MAKVRPNSNWQQKVLEWQASGKSGMAWCKENQVPYTTFMGWKQRFENPHKGPRTNNQSSKAFIELKDQPLPDSGIALEYQNIKICLQAGFDPIVLKQCLVCLGGVSC
jgi:hypothetical protein